MNWDKIDWRALTRMRAEFLNGTAGAADYWQQESDVASYDATFAQRIGWKWDYVLTEMHRRGWLPPGGEVLDWGCGSGIAGRAFLDFFGTGGVSGLRLWDRSPLALAYATRRARDKYPDLPVASLAAALETTLHRAPTFTGTLLLSHVLTELSQAQTEALVDLASRAECVLWVEPGTYEASLTLIAIRERLREGFNVIAPCTHQTRCGILTESNESHWCHHFAAPPSEVFTDPNWARFTRETGIDLRDLPLSFLILDKRKAKALPAGASRVLGRPRIYKAHALLLACDARGVRERELAKRQFPAEFKALKKGSGDSLLDLNCVDGKIVKLAPLVEQSD